MIRSDLSGLGELLVEREGRVFEQLSFLEQQVVTQDFNEDDWEHLNADEIFVDRLRDYAEAVVVLADALQMRQIAANITGMLHDLAKAKPSEVWTFVPDFDSAISAPLNRVRSYAEALRRAAGLDEAGLRTIEVGMLERVLRNTAKVIHQRGVTPTNEHDIQREMDTVLGSQFPDFTRTVAISGSLKSFRPDCGVTALKAAIEYKFAASKVELNQALGGVLEDLTGYSGSEDWKTFYSVVYMTAPFATEEEFHQHVKSAANWKVILVNGQGARAAVRGRRKTGVKKSGEVKNRSKKTTRSK